VKAIRYLMLGLLISPTLCRAQIFSAPLDDFVKNAQVIARVQVTSSAPEFPFPKATFYCGHTVVGKVVETLKGTTAGDSVIFGNVDPMTVGSQYLVALDTSKDFTTDHIITEVPTGSTSEEAGALRLSCLKRLPELRADWLFTSDFVGPKWVSWGFRVSATSEVAGLEFMGRKGQDLIDTWKYVDGRFVVVSTDLVSKDDPTLTEIFASKFDYPTLYVEWQGYRRYLVGLISALAAER
jgi:hypothetical protein